jgi:stearoyl-CoA desaturase (Delta-9 desaturase)
MQGVTIGGNAALQKRALNVALIGAPLAGSVYAVLYFRRHSITWVEVTCFLLFYLLTGIGIGAGFHRCFTHKSFEPVFGLKILLLILGSLAFQGSAIRWVADHRRHHRFSDHDWDVHSPYTWEQKRFASQTSGLLHAHVGWMFDRSVTDCSVYAPDAIRDRCFRIFHVLYLPLTLASLALPYAYGFVLGGTQHAIACLLLGGFVRATALHNVIWAVNSVGHSYGEKAENGRDESRNNLVLALLSFGEGWHNNHHVAPRSAFNNWNWYQVDLNGLLIQFLERARLVRDVIRLNGLPETLRSFDAGENTDANR